MLFFLFIAYYAEQIIPLETAFPISSQQFSHIKDLSFGIITDRGNQVEIYDGTSNKFNIIASKGNSPAELNSATELAIYENQIFIRDRLGILIFTTQGKFIKRYRIDPLHYMSCVFGSSGYITYDHILFSDNEILSYKWTKLDGSITKTVYEVENPRHHKYDRNILPIYPVTPFQTPVVNTDGTLAAIPMLDAFGFFILELKSGNIVRKLELPYQKMKFDKDHGIEILNKRKKSLSSTKTKIEYLPPEYYPPLQALYRDGRGNILAWLWQKPSKRDKLICIDWQGKTQPVLELGWSQQLQVLAVVEKKAFVSIMRDDEGAIAIIPEAELASFLTANKIDYEELTKKLMQKHTPR